MKPVTHLIYLYADNLYGYAMSQPLPTADFIWVPAAGESLDPSEILNLTDKVEVGFIYGEDLETMLSPLQHTFLKHPRPTATTLAPNLRAKTNYVVHYRNLKYYLKQCMVLIKIHHVLAFTQSPWLTSKLMKIQNLTHQDQLLPKTKLMNNIIK